MEWRITFQRIRTFWLLQSYYTTIKKVGWSWSNEMSRMGNRIYCVKRCTQNQTDWSLQWIDRPTWLTTPVLRLILLTTWPPQVWPCNSDPSTNFVLLWHSIGLCWQEATRGAQSHSWETTTSFGKIGPFSKIKVGPFSIVKVDIFLTSFIFCIISCLILGILPNISVYIDVAKQTNSIILPETRNEWSEFKKYFSTFNKTK